MPSSVRTPPVAGVRARACAVVVASAWTACAGPQAPGPVASPGAVPASMTHPAATRDFELRCRAEGVVRCVGFDDMADFRDGEGRTSGITPGASRPAPDEMVKASGKAALRFTIPSRSGANTSGTYFTNFSDDYSVQFGESEEFFVQWRQRFSRELLEARYRGGGGWKLAIVTTGDTPGRKYGSCTAVGIVLQNYYQRGLPILYNSCTGSTSHGPYDGFYERIPGDYRLQNARGRPYCLYSQEASSFFPPHGNCFQLLPDQWMTFQLRVQTGPRVNDEFVGSRITLWAAREGQPSEPVIDWGPYNLSAGRPADAERYGKVWLLPYNTGKDASEAHPEAYTWYDELIVSRRRIADPGTLAGSVPAAPGPRQE